MPIKGLTPKASSMWAEKFERAHQEGPEAFGRVWLDFIKIRALQHARKTGDPSVWNALSATLDRFYDEHCT
ncbi:hypothetical protein NOD94_029300 [Streptomyces sp. Isolate_45]|nr:hypothetical protein [Streptomyces sp. Isolate_45]